MLLEETKLLVAQSPLQQRDFRPTLWHSGQKTQCEWPFSFNHEDGGGSKEATEERGSTERASSSRCCSRPEGHSQIPPQVEIGRRRVFYQSQLEGLYIRGAN